MKPSLYLLKKQNGRTEATMNTEVHVVVVDLDKSKKIPSKFCLHPSTSRNIAEKTHKHF
jgi:hypothetical protein